jgi:hypothetical protein
VHPAGMWSMCSCWFPHAVQDLEVVSGDLDGPVRHPAQHANDQVLIVLGKGHDWEGRCPAAPQAR